MCLFLSKLLLRLDSHGLKVTIGSFGIRLSGGEPGFSDSGVFSLGVGFRVQGSGFRVQGSGFRVQGSGFRVQGSGFRV